MPDSYLTPRVTFSALQPRRQVVTKRANLHYYAGDKPFYVVGKTCKYHKATNNFRSILFVVSTKIYQCMMGDIGQK